MNNINFSTSSWAAFVSLEQQKQAQAVLSTCSLLALPLFPTLGASGEAVAAGGLVGLVAAPR